MSQKRKRTPSPTRVHSKEELYFTSQTIEDRKSKFVGLYSPTLSYQQLQKVDAIASASHKIAAWRRESNQQSLTSSKRYVTGFDDDGEKYAGKKVEQALNSAAVTGSCVVGRWWGGVMLGPTRFEHIEICAREAIQKWRDSIADAAAKKQRIEADEADRQKLVKALAARDSNILVLRRLAAEKEMAVRVSKQDQPESSSGTATIPTATVAAIDYDKIPLDKLRTLDRARDATIAFLLKRIDRAEAELRDAS